MIAQAIDDVALRHDADDLVALDHRQGADPPLAEGGNGFADAVVGADRRDLAALG
jgi:hypothetical protein